MVSPAFLSPSRSQRLTSLLLHFTPRRANLQLANTSLSSARRALFPQWIRDQCGRKAGLSVTVCDLLVRCRPSTCLRILSPYTKKKKRTYSFAVRALHIYSYSPSVQDLFCMRKASVVQQMMHKTFTCLHKTLLASLAGTLGCFFTKGKPFHSKEVLRNCNKEALGSFCCLGSLRMSKHISLMKQQKTVVLLLLASSSAHDSLEQLISVCSTVII